MEHLAQLQAIFEKFCSYRLSLNPKKCAFMVRQGKIIEHIVSKNGISTNEEKIIAIAQMPKPTNAKQVQGFTGHCGYSWRFIYMYAMIAKPLYSLLVVLLWIDEWKESFNKLKEALGIAPILKGPNGDLIYHVCMNASSSSIGAILAQSKEPKTKFPISYASRKLNSA